MEQLLVDLKKRGISLWLDGDRLGVHAPRGALTEDVRVELSRHKAGLVDLLRSHREEQEKPQQVRHDLAARHQPFPLTDVQHAYWMGRKDLVELGKVSTHFYFELDAEVLDVERASTALQALVQRHEMLRAVVDEDGQQRILEAVPPYRIAVEDCSRRSAEEAEGAVLDRREAMSHEVRPAHRWPLFDIRATRMPDGHTRLHVSLDMLIVDAWSMFILFREWFQLYQAPGTPLPRIGVSYRDYLLAERQLAGGAAHRRALEYWMARVDGLPPAPELPVKAGGTGGEAPRFSRRRARLERARWERLKERARDHGLTVSGLLLAAYAEVLARWSRTPHFTLNLTLFNRLPLHPDVGALIGDFTSLVLVEVDHREPGTTFADRARRVQRQLLDDLSHRELSGVEVLREWTRRRGAAMQASMPVVFTSALVLRGEGEEDAGLVERFGPMVYGVSQTPQVWLDNQAMELGGDLVFNWDAVDAVFEEGVLDAMFETYLRLLGDLADSADAWALHDVARLPAAMEARRRAANATEAALPERLLHEGFVAQARSNPARPAVITPERTLTYGELLARASALAAELTAGGAGVGDRVAILMHKGWEQVVGVMGALLSGAAYLPVDAGLPLRRQRDLLEIAGVRQLVTQPGVLDPAVPPEGCAVHVVEPSAPAAVPVPTPRATLDDLAYVIFTSGTTGTPKGVMIDHRGAVNTVEHVNRMYGVGPDDRVLGVSSLSFDLSVYDVFGLLSAGGALVLPALERYLDAAHWRSLLVDHRVTLWNSAPQLMRMLLDSLGQAETGSTALREVLLSGDWIPLDTPSGLARHFPGARLTSLGGATEGSIWSIFHRVQAVDPRWVSIPYGRALPNQTMHVLDALLRPCPEGVTGRIYIGGLGVAKGYWGDEEKTRSRFVVHPRTGARLYDTGDLGRWTADGEIQFLGRDDDQVKIRGHRVEPGEVAGVLRRHPEVREAAVAVTGPRERRELVAYVELDAEHVAELGEVLAAPPPAAALSGGRLRETLADPALTADAAPTTPQVRRAWELLDTYYLTAVMRTFARLGVAGTVGERVGVPRLTAAGVLPRYSRWLRRGLGALAEEGCLRRVEEGEFEVVRIWRAPDFGAATVVVGEGLRIAMGFSAEEIAWFAGAVERLHEVLTGQLDPADLFAAAEARGVHEKLFAESHAQLARVVRRLIEVRGEGFDVLEVGAGLGSATQFVLPILQGAGCRYAITDVSPDLLERMKGIFGERSGATSYGLFDLELRPELQGWERHGHELVLASSVFQDVDDVGRALGNLRGLLRPGGQLVLLEATHFHRSFDLHAGLLQGLDAGGKEPNGTRHGLRSKGDWDVALRGAGFVDVAVADVAGTASEHLGVSVIVATAPLEVVRLDPRAVARHLAESLPDYMVPRTVLQVERMPVTANGKIDHRALPAVPENPIVSRSVQVELRDEIERQIWEVWTRMLKRTDIGVRDNFFDLGGDSLTATNLVRELNEIMPIGLELPDLMERQTVEAMAELARERRDAPVDPAGAAQDLERLFPALAVPADRIVTDVAAGAARIAAMVPSWSGGRPEGGEGVLVTGASGWIGAYLVAELLRRTSADVHCLVRASDAREGHARVVENLRQYRLITDPAALRRIRPVVGALEAPGLGLDPRAFDALAAEVGAIYHFAASVSLLADYGELVEVNARPVEELVRFALRKRRKQILFGSSLAVNIRHRRGGFEVLCDEAVTETPEGLLNGYGQSKWAAEQLLVAAARHGVPSKLFRISHVLAAENDLARIRNYMVDSVVALARKVPAVPDWPASSLYGVPADRVAALVLEAGQQPSEGARVVHLENRNPTDLPTLVQVLHDVDGVRDAPRVALDEWLRLCVGARHQLTGEHAEMTRRLFAPTPAGSVVEVMFSDQRVDTGYVEALPGGREMLTDLSTPDYWRRFAQSTGRRER